jgi:alanine racemase
MSDPIRAEARIDAAAIERNAALLASRAPGAELCVVVKADGYGHGALTTARAALAGGATTLAVATAAEALELRRALPEARILCMGALTVSELDIALEARAEVGLWDGEFLELMAARASAEGVRLAVHVKHDSGMGRLGERDPRAVAALVDRVAAAEALEARAVWTHFATADELDSVFFDEQLDAFEALVRDIRSRHPSIAAHAANSAATLRDPRAHFDMVRCGVAVYGLDPFNTDPASQGLNPALALHSTVAAVKRFEEGAGAGYGRRWLAPRETWVAVLPIGYGDGVRRILTNNADVIVGGRRAPLVGTVSMDNITVDLGPETNVRPGDDAVLIGAQGEERILCEEVALRASTINYEITCGLSARVPRRVIR